MYRKITGPLGLEILYETGQLRTVVTDVRANATEYLLNENGSPERITEPGGVVTEMTWAADDIYKTSETDASQRVTLFEYDSRANLTKETIQAGGTMGDVVTEFAYDPNYNKMTVKRVHNVDAQGAAVVQETIFEIDPSNGNLLSTRDAEGNVTTFSYRANGDLEFVYGPRPGQQQSFDYDAYGNPRTAVDGEHNVTTTEYDARSRLLSQTDTFGRSLTQVPDALDRITSVTREDVSGSSATETSVRTYYPGGQVLTERNRLGLTTTNTYDVLNRLTQGSVSGPHGPTQTVATMDYDAVGNKLFETDVSGNRVDFVYDELYRVKERTLPTDPDNHVERFTHDHAGNKLSESDANGNTTFYEYDRLNRLTKRTDADGNVVELDYDEAGNTLVERDVIRGLRTAGGRPGASFDLDVPLVIA